MFDQFELMADPKAQKKFNRIMKKRQKEFDQGYWWKKRQTYSGALTHDSRKHEQHNKLHRQ